MASKALMFVFSVLALVLLIASDVAARDLTETTNVANQKSEKTDTKMDKDQYGGGGYPGGGGGYPGGGGYQGGGGYPGGGGYHGGGGYPGGGGYHGGGGYPGGGGGGYHGGGGGYCRYGCCYRGYNGCGRCCSYAGETVETQVQNKPHN